MSKKDKKAKPNRQESQSQTFTASGISVPRDIIHCLLSIVSIRTVRGQSFLGQVAEDTVVLAADRRGAAHPVVLHDGVVVTGPSPELVPDLGRFLSGPVAAAALGASSDAGNDGADIPIFSEDLLVLRGAAVDRVASHTAEVLSQLLHPRVFLQ